MLKVNLLWINTLFILLVYSPFISVYIHYSLNFIDSIASFKSFSVKGLGRRMIFVFFQLVL